MGVRKWIVLSCLCAPAAWGQMPIAFEQSIAAAIQNNADLRSARANLAAAEERARAVHSGFYPEVSANVGYVDRSGTLDPVITPNSGYTSNLTITQNLFAGFQDQARVEQGMATVDSAQAGLIAAKARLSSDLKAAFAGLLYAQNNVTLTEDILRRLEENLRLVELRFEGGRENKGALLLTQAAVAQGRFERLQARQALTSAQAQLAAVTGQLTTELQAVGAVPLDAPPPAPDFDALAREAPEVHDAAARERAAAADVRLARSGFYPSVNVSGTIGRDGSLGFPSDDRRTVSANISIPLYSGGRDYYGVRGALAALDAVRADRESVEQRLLVRLKQSYAVYVESVERLEVDREFLTATATRADIARARYQNGLVSFEDWDRAENDLIQRQRALLAAQRDRVNAEAAWELAQGRGVIP